MSTIEKALEKMGQKKTPSEPATSASPVAIDPIDEVMPEQTEVEVEALKPLSSAPAKPILQLPLKELAAKGMLTPLLPRSRIAEEYRTIKRPLLRNIDGATAAQVDNVNLVMVTSALQGDGKTFTAINLALSIATEQDKTVLFVDADVAKASAGSMLGIPSSTPGLLDVLEKKGVALQDLILQTSIENLRILPAGNVNEHSTELLASENMKRLMAELAGRYPDRVIVFDSPPLLLTTESSVLANFMGQIVFVVSTDETPQEAITEALQHIGADKIVGTVLNKAHERRNSLLGLGYGAGYGYGYGYGYGHEGRRETGAKAEQ